MSYRFFSRNKAQLFRKLGKICVNGGWPHSGEIDIMENVGFDPDTIVGSAHTLAYHHSIGTHKNGKLSVPDNDEQFTVAIGVVKKGWTKANCPKKWRWIMCGCFKRQIPNELVTDLNSAYTERLPIQMGITGTEPGLQHNVALYCEGTEKVRGGVL